MIGENGPRNDVKERRRKKREKKKLGKSIEQSETKRCSDWLEEKKVLETAR